jgi:hypothetical protein
VQVEEFKVQGLKFKVDEAQVEGCNFQALMEVIS